MAQQHEEGSLHDCQFCAGSGFGATEFLPCYWCKGSGRLDERPPRDFDDWKEPPFGEPWGN